MRFLLKILIFLNSVSSAAALVFYLPGVCTHTYTKGKQRKTGVRNILESLEKTQYLMNTLYVFCFLVAVTDYLDAGEEDKMEGNAENVYTV